LGPTSAGCDPHGGGGATDRQLSAGVHPRPDITGQNNAAPAPARANLLAHELTMSFSKPAAGKVQANRVQRKEDLMSWMRAWKAKACPDSKGGGFTKLKIDHVHGAPCKPSPPKRTPSF
jgi:hypothetical protein